MTFFLTTQKYLRFSPESEDLVPDDGDTHFLLRRRPQAHCLTSDPAQSDVRF